MRRGCDGCTCARDLLAHALTFTHTGRMGPILRYDTVVDFTYHAFALLVTSDVGSSYSPPPALLLEWDATGGAAALETAFADRLSLSDRQEDDASVNSRWVRGKPLCSSARGRLDAE